VEAVRRLAVLSALLLIVTGCEAYLEEKLEFLELPFEYEGRLRTNNFDPEWDLAWGVPDNGDDSAVYFVMEWGEVYYWESGENWYYRNITDTHRTSLASMSVKRAHVEIFFDGTTDEVLIIRPAGAAGPVNTGINNERTLMFASGDLCYAANLEQINMTTSLIIQVYNTDPLVPTITGPVDILSADNVLYDDVTVAAFPEADDTWGPVTMDFLAFAPDSLASWDGKHKFIVSRTDGVSGERKVMLVSVDESDYSLSVRRLSANRDFHFVSRDRFVGMKGNTLKIFNSAGEELAEYTLEGMRLLGYRSSTDPELIFLYRSEEDGDRVWGIYSLPAAFVREAR
jgi:hypothetical protein